MNRDHTCGNCIDFDNFDFMTPALAQNAGAPYRQQQHFRTGNSSFGRP